ncbi:MAG: two-component hybrid sensor and regulator, partial [Betaproteobacteria bacterium]|nr:two-component hybrid sensor and regulator [Betaproteobacteria bacterium]
ALCDTLRDYGHETVGFNAGEAALAALRETKFDLLLADLMMPGMDGIALLRAAREMDADLVGIIMTGAGSVATAVEAMKVGAFDYILKPFKASVILPVLARALTVRRLRMENAELEQRLRKHVDALEAANKELEAFSYSVSHDLRSPLRAINGYPQMIEEQLGDKLDEETKRLLNVVVDTSHKMGMLIDDLLAFSKLGRQPLNAKQVDMNSVVKEAWSEASAGSSVGTHDFRLQSLPDVWCDRALLKQVWANLLSNAVKYSSKRDKSVIEVGAEDLGTEIVYCVRDNGAGFDMRYVDKLFEVFKRLHSEDEFSGTGVGLAIVHRIVTRHGGRVWAEGKVDEGASLYFSLPMRKNE